MRISLEKESSVITSESEFFGGNRSAWDNSSDSSIPKSSVVISMGASAHDSHNTKLLCFQFRDQDSSSTTQSTGQSDSEVVGIKGATSLYGQTSGHDESSGKSMIGAQQAKQIPSMGAHEFMFASQLDCAQPIAHIPFQYGEPYFGGLLAAAAYGGPHAMNYHSQFVGVSPARVPLPLGHLTEDEPIYVNAKQYGAILRRRQSRAKLEAQNKLVKARKPYLHESRHLHALKRARGSGGRFLTAKEIRGSKDGSGQSENINNKKEGSSTTSCSERTSGGGSNGDVFRQREFGFPGYAACHMHHQNHHHVSARQ